MPKHFEKSLILLTASPSRTSRGTFGRSTGLARLCGTCAVAVKRRGLPHPTHRVIVNVTSVATREHKTYPRARPAGPPVRFATRPRLRLASEGLTSAVELLWVHHVKRKSPCSLTSSGHRTGAFLLSIAITTSIGCADYCVPILRLPTKPTRCRPICRQGRTSTAVLAPQLGRGSFGRRFLVPL
jgi:hypothetical protein